MSLQLRTAAAEDAEGIGQVKNGIWPEEVTPLNYIAQVIQRPDHHAIVALDNGYIVGFVDSFITLGAAGQRRWEVDLLAVHPDHQGRGIGSQLVQATTTIGWQMGAECARGLVAVPNIGSQKAFARAGYTVEERPLNLWVSPILNSQFSILNSQLPVTSHLIPVTTLNYQGAWLEGQVTATSLVAAQAICTHRGWDITGVLIPIADLMLNETAHKANYAFVNQYQFWQQVLPRCLALS
jgi:ribosomal protein S18 acetylase RimI-like enzyme